MNIQKWITEYTTREYETPEKYRDQWQTSRWKISKKIDDKKSDEKNQISKVDEEKIIEDKEIMKLQNLSKEIEKINRKEQDGLESYKYETDEIDQIEISYVLIRIDSQNNLMMMI